MLLQITDLIDNINKHLPPEHKLSTHERYERPSIIISLVTYEGNQKLVTAIEIDYSACDYKNVEKSLSILLDNCYCKACFHSRTKLGRLIYE